MNQFGTLLAWANSFMNHTALPAIARFAAGVIHDELPVAESFVAKIIGSIPADLVASKPLVAFSTIVQTAGQAALDEGKSVGMASLTIASHNALQVLQNAVPVTQVDATDAMNAVENDRAAAIAAINKEADSRKLALSTAADKAAAELKAKVSN